jgi:hypothetical protein
VGRLACDVCVCDTACSDEESSSQSSADFSDGDFFSDMEEQVQDDVVEDEGDGWINDSPEPPRAPPSKLVIRRPFASPGAATASTPQVKTESPFVPTGRTEAGAKIASSATGGSVLLDGLQACACVLRRVMHY